MTEKIDIAPHALYIHVPFCARKCNYCDFHSMVSDTGMIDRYLHALEKELALLPGEYLFQTVYIGGGTPSVLKESQLEKLLSCIIRCIPASEIREYTVEVNPGTLTKNKVELLKGYRVNRISLGVQSFQNKQLELLGRIHSGDDARDAFALLRKNGFQNVNIDLIFGCPEQTPDDWERDLRTAVELNPEHLSAYSLTYEEGTPLAVDLKNAVVDKLEECVELEMYKMAIDYLTRNRYHHYEISNFARDGYECCHNRVYWENREYVGVGTGAHSFLHGMRTANEKDVLKYIQRIQENTSIKLFGECLPPDRLASETVIMSLRLRQGISNAVFYKRFGYALEDQFGDQINRLRAHGLVAFEDERLKLTEKGLFVADTVMTEFL
ncbi:MAG: radical SAM family heme chaperone HemW [Candidatus Brocadia sp.]|nr:radical SAM family heme chaperone HemW [Candidatus Brocadia sp.]